MIHRWGLSRKTCIFLCVLLLMMLFVSPVNAYEDYKNSDVNNVIILYKLEGEADFTELTSFPLAQYSMTKRIFIPEAEGKSVTIAVHFENTNFYGVIDYISLDKNSPDHCIANPGFNISEAGMLKKVAKIDFDVLQSSSASNYRQSQDSQYSFVFHFPKGGTELELNARSEGDLWYHLPFIFPESNYYVGDDDTYGIHINVDSDYEVYTIESNGPTLSYDMNNPPDISEMNLLYSAETKPTTGHPDGLMNIYAVNDEKYIYLYADCLSDNTLDFGADYFMLYFRDEEIKGEPYYLILYSDNNIENSYNPIPADGNYCYFHYDDSGYQHMSYAFKIDLSQLQTTKIGFVFEFYGTAATSPFAHQYKDYHINNKEEDSVVLYNYLSKKAAGSGAILDHGTSLDQVVSLCSGCFDGGDHSNTVRITGNSPGTDILSTRCKYGARQTSNIYVYALAESVDLLYDSSELQVGQSVLPTECKVTLEEEPKSGDDLNLYRKGVRYESTDSTVIKVDSATGKVTAVSPGTAEVVVYTEAMQSKGDNYFAPAQDSFTFTVTQGEIVPVSEIKVNPAELKLYVGDTSQLSATITPDNASDKSITWTSSDETIATVDQNGQVTAKKVGIATVTAMTADGKSDRSVITVSERQTPTPEPTNTPVPSSTPEPTNTPEPTSTPEPTNTPAPTSTPVPTPSPTPKPSTSPKTGDSGISGYIIIILLATATLVFTWIKKQNVVERLR